jgi:hypothetical protein
MNYSNHNLRTDLQEWKSRLYRSTYQQFGHQLKYFFQNINGSKQLYGLLNEAVNQHFIAPEKLTELNDDIDNGKPIIFESEIDQAAFCYQFLQYFFLKHETYDLHHFMTFQRKGFEDTKSRIIEDYISPIVYYLHARLDKSNAIIFLLEKYKRRTEWFTKEDLLNRYQKATKSYEKIFEDDLRLFLFDQGIDYPFSTPSSASGRADIVGAIETDDPLIIEIKIVDKERGYGKERIKGGFTQIVKYANDYSKDVGYLVIFNLDNSSINLKLDDSRKTFPASFHYENKTFYFIVINCSNSESASKSSTIKELTITKDELTIK